MNINIPEKALVLMIGSSCSGKSTFCKWYFKPEDVIESDHFRELLSGDKTNQIDNTEVFNKIYEVIEYRMKKGIFTVLDATNLVHEHRAVVLNIAKKYNMNTVAIAFDVPENVILTRKKNWIPLYVIKNHVKAFNKTKPYLRKDFKYSYMLDNPDFKTVDDKKGFYCMNNATNTYELIEVRKVAMSSTEYIDEFGNNKDFHYYIIGDIHGCSDELDEMLSGIPYSENCKIVFVGDLVDRGTSSIKVLKTVMRLCKDNEAHCVMGNHDNKFLRAINRGQVQVNNTLAKTLEEYYELPKEEQIEIREFLESLPSHLVLDHGKLVVSHAGIKEEYIGRDSKTISEFCMYGDVDGSKDKDGYPIRRNWARDYRGSAVITYGHTPHTDVVIENNTYNIDTGCSFGNKLTAIKYPEMTYRYMAAKQTYFARNRDLDDGFDIQAYIPNIKDYIEKDSYITTFDNFSCKIPVDNMKKAVASISNYGVDPRWMIYIPPTMSPCETSSLPDYLEYPTEAFEYYKSKGLKQVICERKHMGSRGIIIVCKDNATAKRVFHITNDEEFGIIYSRKGKRFFGNNPEYEVELLDRLRAKLIESGYFANYNTDWVALDCEIMPWSDKAKGLIKNHYAPVGRVGVSNLSKAHDLLSEYLKNYYPEMDPNFDKDKVAEIYRMKDKFNERCEDLKSYIAAYRNYCQHVESVDDITVAPFHILAFEHTNNTDVSNHKSNHLDTINKYIVDNKNFISTPHIIVELDNEDSVKAGIDWWLDATNNGYEGMVVKPTYYTMPLPSREIIQPAIKCRGRECLRIIYGPEYTSHIDRLKKRSLSAKRNLAIAEFELGKDSLEKFVNKEPFYMIHRDSLAVLGLEYDMVDPRL